MAYTTGSHPDGSIVAHCEICIDGVVVGHGRCRLAIGHRDMEMQSMTAYSMPKRLMGNVGTLSVHSNYTELSAMHDKRVDLRLRGGGNLRGALLSRHSRQTNQFAIYEGYYST